MNNNNITIIIILYYTFAGHGPAQIIVYYTHTYNIAFSYIVFLNIIIHLIIHYKRASVVVTRLANKNTKDVRCHWERKTDERGGTKRL